MMKQITGKSSLLAALSLVVFLGAQLSWAVPNPSAKKLANMQAERAKVIAKQKTASAKKNISGVAKENR